MIHNVRGSQKSRVFFRICERAWLDKSFSQPALFKSLGLLSTLFALSSPVSGVDVQTSLGHDTHCRLGPADMSDQNGEDNVRVRAPMCVCVFVNVCEGGQAVRHSWVRCPGIQQSLYFSHAAPGPSSLRSSQSVWDRQTHYQLGFGRLTQQAKYYCTEIQYVGTATTPNNLALEDCATHRPAVC